MIPTREQWAIQIDVTNACPHACSNCTRLTGHVKTPFYMPVQKFQEAVVALKPFLTESRRDAHGRRKVIGIIGGEPLLHPEFDELVEIVRREIPDSLNRGLWTCLDMKMHPKSKMIRDTFGYINENHHDTTCVHSPVLVAISDVVKDEQQRKQIIDKCWLQKIWAGSVTPKGFFFCEVAGALDMVLNGPGGVPIDASCWDRPLSDFADQIERWCNRCGIALNLKGRIDNEEKDDMSVTNIATLRALNSPRVTSGNYVEYDADEPRDVSDCPWRYLL